MNDKTFFRVGIFFLIIGGAAFFMVTKPWKNFQNEPPLSEISEEKNRKNEVVVLNLPEKMPAVSQTITEEVTPENFLHNAEKFLAQGNFTGAIEMAQKYKTIYPQNTTSHEIIVDANIKLSQYFQAEESINRLITLQNTPQNQVKKIEILMLAGKKDDAKKSIKILPQSEEKVFYQLLISVVEERNEDTKKHAKTLIETNSQYKKTAQEFLNIFDNYKDFRDGSPHYLRTMMANMLNILDYHLLTIQFIKPTLEEYPDYRDAWILMGNSYLALKKFDLAERMLETAVSLDPSHPQTPYLLAIALAETGHHDDSIEQFNNALKNQYKPASKVERYIAETYLRQKKYSEAIEHYQEVISDTENVEFQDYILAITVSLNNLNAPDLALKTATKMNTQFPENPRSLPFLAWALIESGNISQARSALVKSIEKNPNLADNYLFMGQLYEKENRKQEAFDAYKKGYQIDKGSPVSRECAQRYNALKK